MAGIVLSVALTQHKDLHIGSAQQTLVDFTMKGTEKCLRDRGTVVREFSGETVLTLNPFSAESGSCVCSMLGWRDKDTELTALRIPV